MSEEKSAGASYLNALKRGVSSAAAAGRTTARNAGATAENSQRSEKRRSPRYRCQGSAHLREISTGSSTWATFTDISLYGCYVEAMSAYGIGAELAMTIEVNNYRVECRGTVRVVYPGLGMGISFSAMPEAHRERLSELVRSLTRPSVLLGLRPPSIPAAESTRQNSFGAVSDPGSALAAVSKFFEERQMLSRDEFFRILRKSQG